MWKVPSPKDFGEGAGEAGSWRRLGGPAPGIVAFPAQWAAAEGFTQEHARIPDPCFQI